MNIKIAYHIMPWEIDYALLSFTQFKKSKYYLSEDINITIDSVLNLSSYLINWKDSKIQKEYFIEKYNQISQLLVNYNHNKRIYDGNEIYGHLNLQRECIEDKIDYYISLCPDMYFSEYLLHYLIEGITDIKDKYFILSPQHRKLSDSSWDATTDPDYMDIPYSECNNIDIFDLRFKNKHNNNVSITLEERGKYAGWFDVYSKEFYENIAPIHDDWNGYGPWDWYSLILGNIVKQKGIDIKHYTLRGQTIGEYWVGPLLKNDGYSGYYKNQLVLNDIPSQRQIFESNMENYVKKGLQMLKEKNII